MQPGYGATLYVDTSGGTTWTEVGGIETLDPDFRRAAIKATPLKSAHEDYFHGRLSGQFQFTVFFDPSTEDMHDALSYLVMSSDGATAPARAKPNFKIVDDSGNIYIFKGMISGLKPTFNGDDVLKASFTVELCSLVELTPGDD